MSSYINLVLSMTMQQLHSLTTGFGFKWEDHPDLHTAIFDRYHELVNNGEILGDGFGDAYFWDFVFGNESESETDDVIHDEHGDQGQIGGAAPNLNASFDVKQQHRVEVRKFGVTGTAYDLKFENMDNVEDLNELLGRAIQTVIERAFSGAEERDLVGMEINAPGMHQRIQIPFSRRSELTPEKVLHHMEAVIQSNENVVIDDNLHMRTTHVRLPNEAGTGKTTSFWSNHLEFLKQRAGGHGAGLMPIHNEDQLCIARAIVLGICRAERNESIEKKNLYNSVRHGDKNRYTKQRTMAQDLMRRAGLDLNRPCGLEEYPRLQEAMPDQYRLCIYSKDHYFSRIYAGDDERPQQISLYVYDTHCALINSMPQFFGRSYWCFACDKGYNSQERHKCAAVCPGCLERPPCITDQANQPECSDCNRIFRSQQCFDAHRRNYMIDQNEQRRKRKPLCLRLKLCKECGHELSPGHRCGYSTCKICKEEYRGDHLCYVNTYTARNHPRQPRSFIFFDAESTIDTPLERQNEFGSMTEHIVNCVTSIKVCDQCWRAPEDNCTRCGPADVKLRVYTGDHALDDFCKYLFSPDNKGSCCIAHNMRGYDGQFLLQFLDRQGCRPKLVVKGLELYSIEVSGIRVVDSLSYMPFKLAAMSKAFNINEEKGYYPFKFNTAANYGVTLDHLPDISFYDPDGRSEKDRKALETWHEAENERLARENGQWSFWEELVMYCKADTILLAKAAMTFRDNLMTQTGIDPFNEALTIAGTCMKHYLKNHLTKGQIALIPEGGYRREKNQSVMALKYLRWRAEQDNFAAEGKVLQHAGNGPEFQIPGTNYKVDGHLKYLDGTDAKQVYEVHGCVWHGCPICYKERNKPSPTGHTMEELFQRTQKRTREIRNAGYQVTEVWEHEIRQLLKNSPEMKDFFDRDATVYPMDPREAFYGGRVAALRLQHTCAPGERIHYYDVVSLYPWVNKFGRYPGGHATVITENFVPLVRDQNGDWPYEGIIKLKVLAPKHIFHPILPYRRKSDKKLLFSLCRTCADTQNQGICDHDQDQRAFTGSWATPELYKALDHNYRVLEVYEIYHWDLFYEYDGRDPKTGLFTEYVNFAMKMKIEASGWPADVQTDEQKDEFVRSYLENENIQLDPQNMEYNAALRSLAKLIANSFWGKMGQRSDLSKVEYFTDPAKFFSVVCDPENQVQAIRICTEKKVALTYKKVSDFVETQKHVSVPHAVFTTTLARLKLLSFLEPLGDRVLYADTDSIVFVSRGTPGEYMPPTGPYLGNLSDELAEFGPGSYCQSFYCGGPKAYAMEIWSTTQQKYVHSIKLRGFTLNSATSKRLNLKTLKRLTSDYLHKRGQTTDSEDVVYRRIGRTRERKVISFHQRKRYRIVFDKVRVLFPEGNTKPFGFE